MVIACAIFMEQFDATVLATALPAMARDFHVPAPAMSIALTSYLLALAALIPVSGVLADRFGARKVFMSSIGLFVLGSVTCSVAESIPQMVCARLLQGMGGAMMTPIGRLIILQTVDRRDLVSAMSYALVPAFLGPMLGPPVGGLIVAHLSWHWIFYLNLPIGMLGLWLTRRYIPALAPRPSHHGFDRLGFVYCGLASGCLLFGLEGLDPLQLRVSTMLLIATGLLAGLAYMRHARQQVSPLLDLGLLRIDSFRLSVIAGGLMRITQGAQPFLLPMMFQLGFGFSPEHSGSLVLATTIGAVVMRSLTPRLLARIGFRSAMLVNGLLASLGYGLCALFRPGWPEPLMFVCLFACGAFMSFQFGAYNTIAYEAVPSEAMSRANSFYTMLQQWMLSVGVCAGALLLRTSMVLTGHLQPSLSDFSLAFIGISLMSLTSLYWHRQFATDAGAELSGHRTRPRR